MEEKILITVGFIGFISVFPFAVFRLLQNEIIAAIADFMLCFTLLACSVYVIKTHKVKGVKLVIAASSLALLCVTVYLFGVSQVFWAYPAILATYYMVSHKQALILSVITSVVVIALIYSEVERVYLGKILVTQLVTNFFAYVFSKLMFDSRQELIRRANQDALTGIGNRRALDDKLQEIILVQTRYPGEACLIVFDLDHFKSVNDEYGHAVGDKVLVSVASKVSERLRSSDFFYRFGGEEFVIIPTKSNCEESFLLAESLRKIIEEIEHEHSIQSTASIGIASFVEGDTSSSWLKRADDALYKSKENGRNRTTIYTNSGNSES